jgi:hypothetical protein
MFLFENGRLYHCNNGEIVKVLAHTVNTNRETLICSDGRARCDFANNHESSGYFICDDNDFTNPNSSHNILPHLAPIPHRATHYKVSNYTQEGAENPTPFTYYQKNEENIWSQAMIHCNDPKDVVWLDVETAVIFDIIKNMNKITASVDLPHYHDWLSAQFRRHMS